MSKIWTFLSRTKGTKKLHITDMLTYLYLSISVVIMFGPVVWLILSSFKSSAEVDKIPAEVIALPAGNH